MPPRPANNAAPPAPPAVDPHFLEEASLTVSRALSAAAAHVAGATEAALGEAGAALVGLVDELAAAAEVAAEAVGDALRREALLAALAGAATAGGEADAGVAAAAAGMRGGAAALAAHADAYAFPAALVQPAAGPAGKGGVRVAAATNLVAAATDFEGLLGGAGGAAR